MVDLLVFMAEEECLVDIGCVGKVVCGGAAVDRSEREGSAPRGAEPRVRREPAVAAACFALRWVSDGGRAPRAAPVAHP